jgi:hypothetical protein
MEKALHENRRKQMFAVPFESKKIMVTRIAESSISTLADLSKIAASRCGKKIAPAFQLRCHWCKLGTLISRPKFLAPNLPPSSPIFIAAA